MIRKPLVLGLAGGFCVALYVYFLDYTQLIYRGPYGAYLGYLAIVILPVFTFFALRAVQISQGHSIGFVQAIMVGLLVSLAAAVGYGVLSFAYTHWVIPDYAERMARMEAEYLRSQNKSVMEIDRSMKKIIAHYTSWKPYINTLIWYIILGLIYSSVSYFILLLRQKRRRSNPPPDRPLPAG